MTYPGRVIEVWARFVPELVPDGILWMGFGDKWSGLVLGWESYERMIFRNITFVTCSKLSLAVFISHFIMLSEPSRLCCNSERSRVIVLIYRMAKMWKYKVEIGTVKRLCLNSAGYKRSGKGTICKSVRIDSVARNGLAI